MLIKIVLTYLNSFFFVFLFSVSLFFFLLPFCGLRPPHARPRMAAAEMSTGALQGTCLLQRKRMKETQKTLDSLFRCRYCRYYIDTI